MVPKEECLAALDAHDITVGNPCRFVDQFHRDSKQRAVQNNPDFLQQR